MCIDHFSLVVAEDLLALLVPPPPPVLGVFVDACVVRSMTCDVLCLLTLSFVSLHRRTITTSTPTLIWNGGNDLISRVFVFVNTQQH